MNNEKQTLYFSYSGFILFWAEFLLFCTGKKKTATQREENTPRTSQEDGWE